MAKLEDLTQGATVKGILPNHNITVIDAKWHGSDVVELTYKDTIGQPHTEILYRDREPDLEVVVVGRPWSFDGDGALLRLVMEAHRIRLAHLFDPLLAVHTSLVEPLPHQITAVYEEMLTRQPLRFLLADDPGAGKTIMAGLFIRELLIRGDLLLGESEMGAQVAEAYKQELTLVEDQAVVDYVNELGQRIAKFMGRDEFDYEFYVVQDDSLNAFALPGGKVFVHTGAILGCNSEAELAGLLGHEVAHAVLSHGFQRIVKNNLLVNLSQTISLGSLIPTLVSLKYSRDNEHQADILGTRVLANTGFAADGLRNFMATIDRQSRSRSPSYLSTHPAPNERVRYLEELIERNGYNRYAFEGVEKHAAIQKRIRESVES
ncbi:MAG: M48 family metalloprotease [Hormoscilla sp. GUM202]|nr:M48 family metalloprotease [Hormoscilla sp. GUM202]